MTEGIPDLWEITQLESDTAGTKPCMTFSDA